MAGDVISESAVAPDGTERKISCSYVSLPAENGSLGVLANHAPMLCALTKGEIVCRNSAGALEKIEVSGGVAQVYKNTVTVLFS